MELRRWITAVCLLVAITCTLLPTSASASDVEGDLTFERDIRPILRAHCLDCHGATEEMEGNLDLRLVRLMQAGGDSGPALIPGNPDESFLLQRVRDGDMPPGEAKVSDAELQLLERWIAQGAPTARPEPTEIGPGLPILPEDRQWWAFQPIQRPEITDLSAHDSIRTPIDALLMQAMPPGLSFSPDADKRTLMLRLYFDLVGLPPSEEELQQFLQDDSPAAYEQLVDRLLQSPHYGERWGRHWLDVAGYADSEGRTSSDALRPWAYKYRDYVVDAFNQDVPLDRMLHEQLAGDELAGPIVGELTAEQARLLTATGFLRMAADGTGSGDNSPEARNQVVADVIQIVSSSLLGLSFACAQCHDHRYDPISHTDYFALRAVFEPALDWQKWKTPQQRYVSLYTQAERQRAAEIEAQAKELVAQRDEKQKKYLAEALDKELLKYEEPLRGELRAAYETPAGERSEDQKALLTKHPSVNITPGVLYQYNQAAADDLKKDADRIAELRKQKPPEQFIRALTETSGQVPETKLFHRGDHRQPKQAVLPAAPTVLCPENEYHQFPIDDPNLPTTGRRLAFAQWLTSPDNPITARVLVNRIWMHHFGRGLVETPSDFGRLGAKPAHPELLDWLASELMAQNWSLKRLHRVIVLSTVYRQAAQRDDEKHAIDDSNHYLWRQSVKRLEAEIVRDRMLSASGQLNRLMYGPAVPAKEDDTGQVVVEGNSGRRSLYIQQRRSQPVAILQAFDAPVMEINCERRPSSTVATQSLMLMNGAFALDTARMLAERVLREAEPVFSDASELVFDLPAIQPPGPPAWQYGYGELDDAGGQVTRFTALPHFESGAWQGGSKRPDPELGWVFLTAAGGHTGNPPGFAAIRRWTAPRSGVVSINGTLGHASPNGDGVRGRIVSSRSGIVGDWIVHHKQTATEAQSVSVEAGDTIDFVTDCRGDVNADSFSWTVQITLATTENHSEVWDSQQGFLGPQPKGESLHPGHLIRAWELAYGRLPSRDELELAIEFINTQREAIGARAHALPPGSAPAIQPLVNLCQILLTSNEFLYID